MSNDSCWPSLMPTVSSEDEEQETHQDISCSSAVKRLRSLYMEDDDLDENDRAQQVGNVPVDAKRRRQETCQNEDTVTTFCDDVQGEESKKPVLFAKDGEAFAPFKEEIQNTCAESL